MKFDTVIDENKWTYICDMYEIFDLDAIPYKSQIFKSKEDDTRYICGLVGLDPEPAYYAGEIDTKARVWTPCEELRKAQEYPKQLSILPNKGVTHLVMLEVQHSDIAEQKLKDLKGLGKELGMDPDEFDVT